MLLVVLCGRSSLGIFSKPPIKKSAAPTEDQAREWLVYYNSEASKQWYKYTEAWWAYNTNITEYNEQVAVLELYSYKSDSN